MSATGTPEHSRAGVRALVAKYVSAGQDFLKLEQQYHETPMDGSDVHTEILLAVRALILVELGQEIDALPGWWRVYVAWLLFVARTGP
jgi:hypothetical protein